MQLELNTYTLPLISAALISGWVAFYSWHHRETRGALALSILAIAIAEWSLTYTFELMGTSLPAKIFWGKVEYLGIAIAPPAWAVFAIQYSGIVRQLSRRQIALFGIIPAITISLVFTTELHGLVWNNLHIEQNADLAVLGVSHGPWFWVHIAYSYLLLVLGAIFILRAVWRGQSLYRGQATALVIAAATPLFGNILYLSGLSPIPLLDLTPFTFTITVASLFWGIFGFRLLDLSPIARENIVDAMKDGIIVIDVQGRIADINPAALNMIGQQGQKVIGQLAQDVLSPWQNLLDHFKDATDTTEEISFGEGATKRWYELNLASLYDQGNRTIGRVITIRNITEPKQAEELKHSFLDDVKALQEIHLALSEVSDLDTLYIKMITFSQQRLGIDRMGLFLIDERTQEFQGTYGVGPDGKTRDERYYREALTSENWSWTKEVMSSPAHANIWENAKIFDNGVVVGTGWKAGAALWNGHKAIGYLSCDSFSAKRAARPYELELISLLGSIFGHLIERLRSELLLQESEVRYRQIVENASDVIYRTDEKGLFTYINPVGLRLIGYDHEEDLLGKHYLEMVAPRFHHRMKRFYEHQFLSHIKNTYHEFVVMSADGSEIWLGQNVQLIEEEENIIGFQAVARDITELKQAHESLALARDQALEASRLKSQLLAKVSHELRTPLSGVLGYAELLLFGSFGPLNEKQKNAANQVIDSANYLSNMVNELLDQAQIESKSVTLHITSFNLRTMIQRIETTMAVLAANKGLRLIVSVTPDLPETISGDQQRLQQILINLAGNAVKFTKIGDIRIKVFSPDQSHWAMQVSDTGAGIPQEAQSYIFEPFRQVNNAITRENRGSGLGLSITKQLVELMGGEITLQSEIDEGSTFTVLLPILKETDKSIHHSQPKEAHA